MRDNRGLSADTEVARCRHSRARSRSASSSTRRPATQDPSQMMISSPSSMMITSHPIPLNPSHPTRSHNPTRAHSIPLDPASHACRPTRLSAHALARCGLALFAARGECCADCFSAHLLSHPCHAVDIALCFLSLCFSSFWCVQPRTSSISNRLNSEAQYLAQVSCFPPTHAQNLPDIPSVVVLSV